MSNFLDKLKFPALFSMRNRWEKRAGDFNLSKKLPLIKSDDIIISNMLTKLAKKALVYESRAKKI